MSCCFRTLLSLHNPSTSLTWPKFAKQGPKEMATIQRIIRERLGGGKASADIVLAYMGSSLNFARNVQMAAKAISFPEFTNRINREIIKRITRSGHGLRGRGTISMDDRKAAIGGDVVGVGMTAEAVQHGLVFDEHGFLKKVGPVKPPPLAFTPMRHNFRGRAWCIVGCWNRICWPTHL